MKAPGATLPLLSCHMSPQSVTGRLGVLCECECETVSDTVCTHVNHTLWNHFSYLGLVILVPLCLFILKPNAGWLVNVLLICLQYFGNSHT